MTDTEAARAEANFDRLSLHERWALCLNWRHKYVARLHQYIKQVCIVYYTTFVEKYCNNKL